MTLHTISVLKRTRHIPRLLEERAKWQINKPSVEINDSINTWATASRYFNVD